MKDKTIRRMPKYIIEKIFKTDKVIHPAPDGHVRFYAYLAIWNKELVKVTVAVKHRYKKWYCKQVAVHGLYWEKCYVKDMEYCGYIGYGYRVGWYEQGLQRCRNWFENEDWGWAEDKYYDPQAPIINTEIISKLPEFKYSAYTLYNGYDLLKYLRLYKQYPQTEYLLKLGLNNLVKSTTILKLIAKDKKFCKWLITNKDEIINNYHYINVIIRAYKTCKPLKDLQSYASQKIRLQHNDNLKPLLELFKGKELERFFSYIEKQNTNSNSYLDYLIACNYLELDMSIDKNRFSNNFKRWHNIRIDEYNTAKALADEMERAELYLKFAEVSEKYLTLQYDKQNSFIVIIARSPADLIREGNVLNHCVGRMNYDQRVIREESLIFFIRNASQPDKPFVTVEYSPKSKKVLQCYGDKDSKPNDNVLNYVNKVWLPYANRKIKKLTA